jgi:hypothetical protein
MVRDIKAKRFSNFSFFQNWNRHIPSRGDNSGGTRFVYLEYLLPNPFGSEVEVSAKPTDQGDQMLSSAKIHGATSKQQGTRLGKYNSMVTIRKDGQPSCIGCYFCFLR